jgi:threonine aldolase
MAVCFSKGLACPFGAIIVGSKSDVAKLKQLRKGLGGGIWHLGIIAAAADYALTNML